MEDKIEGYNILVDVNYFQQIPEDYPKNSFISKEIDELYKRQFLEALNEKEYDEVLIMEKLHFIHMIGFEQAIPTIADIYYFVLAVQKINSNSQKNY
jgi:hypothetical protein